MSRESQIFSIVGCAHQEEIKSDNLRAEERDTSHSARLAQSSIEVDWWGGLSSDESCVESGHVQDVML
jgi:hypothetical protein